MNGIVADKQWQAQDDARTLAFAEAIKQDPGRLKSAQEAAQKMVEQKREEADAMAKVAGQKANNSTTTPAVSKKPDNTTSKNLLFNIFNKIS